MPNVISTIRLLHNQAPPWRGPTTYDVTTRWPAGFKPSG